MLRPEIKLTVDVRPKLVLRRPPRPLIELLEKPEDEFRAYVEEIENSEIFKQLVAIGAVKKVKSGGRVPPDKYEEYMDVQLIQFLRQYRITEHEDWERDFSDRRAKLRLDELAAKYQAPPARLSKMIEYYQRITREDPDAGCGKALFPFEDEGPDYIDLLPSPTEVDLSEAIAVARQFVQTYGVSEEEFRRDFLQGERDPHRLAERYGATVAEVYRVLDAVRSVQIAEAFAAGATAERDAQLGTQPVEQAKPVARVRLADGGRRLLLEFVEDNVYAQRYQTNPSALAKVRNISQAEEAERLLLELQWINQRKSILCRLVTAVCNHQYRYLLTGDPYHLKPLSQAQIARQLGEDEATICRLIRDKFIETPYGVPELRFFFQKKTAVIKRIVERHRNLTDNEIRQILEDEFECKISRRTVAYHRLKAFGDGQQRAARRTNP
ncbi:MAG TPA: hypothetical protein EYP85_05265 [Armatimonadetes bacterium]|nr:hypothetical protein [Armatimonadota bacterium]